MSHLPDIAAGKALAEEFRLANIFCLPATYNDPFPLAILEAMASGLPVVSTKRGGIPEAFVEGGGVLVAPSSARELADAIQKLAFDPGFAGAAGIATATNLLKRISPGDRSTRATTRLPLRSSARRRDPLKLVRHRNMPAANDYAVPGNHEIATSGSSVYGPTHHPRVVALEHP